MDDIDRQIWTSIGLGNQLKELNGQMWDAMMDGKHVSVVIDGETVKTFHGSALLEEQCQTCPSRKEPTAAVLDAGQTLTND